MLYVNLKIDYGQTIGIFTTGTNPSQKIQVFHFQLLVNVSKCGIIMGAHLSAVSFSLQELYVIYNI